MRKGLKLGVTVTRHKCEGQALVLLMRSYIELQANRRFSGLDEELLRTLATQHGPSWQFTLLIARESVATESDEPLGLVVTVQSGDTALYLIASTTEHGRKMQANSVLLWQAILHAKSNGCNWFDIGGLSEITPKGIAEFKQGLNAKPYKLAGEWRSFLGVGI